MFSEILFKETSITGLNEKKKEEISFLRATGFI